MDDLFWGTVSFLLPKDICRFCRFALEQKNTGVTLAGATWKFLASGNPFDLRAGIHPLIIGRGFLKSKHMNIPSKWFSKYFWLGKYPPIHWNNRSWKCNHGSFTWWRLSLTFGEELSNLTYLDHLLRLGLDRVETKVGWTSWWDLTFFWMSQEIQTQVI